MGHLPKFDCLLVAVLLGPEAYLLLDGKLLGRWPDEFRFQKERVGFHGNEEVESGVDEVAYEELGIALDSQDLKLNRVDQGVKQRSLREFLVVTEFM
jgi:hypothetical protein